MNNENTVFIISENDKLNFNQATEYGDLNYLSTYKYSNNVNSNNKRVFSEISNKLKTFNAKGDYLVLCGHPVVIGWTFSKCVDIAESQHVQALNVLVWDNYAKKYFVNQVPVSAQSN